MAVNENLLFEEMLPFFGIHGEVTLKEGPSTNDFVGGNPTRIIQSDQSWNVSLKLETSGLLNYVMAGKFQFRIFLEQMGQGEFALNNSYAIATENFVSMPHTYHTRMDIPRNEVPDGIYKLVVSLTFKGPSGVPAPIAAFADLGLIQFYKEGPTAP